MFPFSSRSTPSDAPEAAPAPAPVKAAEPHPLDALTGGAFSAPTSGERSARIRQWLATQPAADKLGEVFKELSARDKGAARAVRERLDEIRRAGAQQAIAAEWAAKAEALLASAKLNIADAMAWQRDAAKAGAPLSREPLAALKTQLAERVKAVEDLQHRAQVQREAAVLLAQRIEVLSTKPWRDAQAALQPLDADVQHWREQAAQLTGDAAWPSVQARFPAQLESSQSQLQAVWESFQSALAQTVAASEDAQAPLPPVPVWAEELSAARGLPAEPAPKPAPKVDPRQREQAMQAVSEALAKLEQETAEGHGKASLGAAAALRGVLKTQGRYIDDELERRVHAALVAAGELEGWQRWSADQVREDLVKRAEALLPRPEGQTLGGRKMQEALRQLREQWKQADQGAPANHGLWKKFDDACNTAHKVVEQWLDKVRAESAEHRAQRQTLIDEVRAWTSAQAESPAATADWKATSRALHQFSERWRAGGHVSEKIFGELQPLWKQTMAAASAPLEAVQKASLERRHAMIEEAAALGAASALRIDAIKALQQRWQAEAQAVPLDRKHEQKLWDAFRKPLDDAFNRKSAERERAAAELNAHDRAVFEAAKALEAANAGGDAQQIRAAVTALESALRGQPQPPQSQEKPAPAPQEGAQAAAEPASAENAGAENTGAENADAETPPTETPAADATPAPKPAPRPVVAVRGDDRPGMKKAAPVTGRPGERREGRGPRERERDGMGGRGERAEREPRGPRLGDAAFRAQRDALEHAQSALRKLAAQAHGEALTQLLAAWDKRDAALLPSLQELGGSVTATVRGAWAQSLAAAPAGDAAQALLRLEMAAEAPTPAEHLAARRALQLQLLTRRNDPAPAQTWGQDTAQVLAAASDGASARRLQTALKALLRK
jgi:hypothetical protein